MIDMSSTVPQGPRAAANFAARPQLGLRKRWAVVAPFFSICIPQYNRTSFLLEACRSLAEQTFRDFEVCISDDRSTDGGEPDLLAYLEQSSLSFAYQQRETNGRYDANLRTSLSLARGKYCFLLGNDDSLASPTTLEELAAEIQRLGPAGVVMTNYEDFATGAAVERVRRTEIVGSGPAVAAASFRNFSFVSGVVLERESVQLHATNRWDGSEMYQMYLGCRIIAEGGRLLNIRRVTIRKDIQLPDQRVDSYALKPRIARCPVEERRLPMVQIGRLVVDAIAPYPAPRRLTEKVVAQLLLFTYPFWIVEYRRIQSSRYALGVCLGMRPRNLLQNVPISWAAKLRLRMLYAAVTLGGLLVPIKAFQAMQARLYSLAKSRTARGQVRAHSPLPPASCDLVVVGNRGGTNVGWSLWNASLDLGIRAHFADALEASRAPAFVRRVFWRMLGHRPPRLSSFSAELVRLCEQLRPGCLLTTGMAPVDRKALAAIGRMNVRRLNFLTDDPWNPSFRAPWFFQALPLYDTVFSARRANMADLERLGCQDVQYLPFAFDPRLCYPQPADPGESRRLAADILFVGGADRDRIPFLAALAAAGFSLALYGGCWERFPETRPYFRGYADPQTLRQATAAARIALCLVRRANRDGHVMRSFEIPAIGACMLVEDTAEHRQIFGPDAEAVVYFRSIPGMIERARWLLDRPAERQRLAAAAYARIINGRHTYQDRLAEMLGLETSEHEDRNRCARPLSRV